MRSAWHWACIVTEAYILCFFRLKKGTDSGLACHSDIHTTENKIKNKEKLRDFCAEDILGYDVVSKQTVMASKCTWMIVVHHKTTAAKVSLCSPPVCCVLVSLIGTIPEVQ
jgi:hypothetical protein